MEAAMVVNYLKPRLSPLLFEEVLKAIRNVEFDQPQAIVESEENDTQGQDLLELENFELPGAVQLQAQYTASATENPRSVQRSVSAPLPCAPAKEQPSAVSTSLTRDRCVSIKDLVVLGGESPTTPATAAVQGDCNLSSSTSSSSPLSTPSCLAPAPPSEALKPLKIAESMSPRLKAEHGGLYVEKGVGSPPRPVRVNSDVCLVDRDVQSDTEAEDMPAAAGAVAAGAVADRLLGPKERRQLAIVLVGLPARGKTFTAAKLTRYLRWLGHDTKHFNVGKYRRLKHGCNQNADFFRVDNHEGVEARQEVAVLAMEDLLLWMQEGGQIGVFDATNSTRQRRDLLMRMAEGKCKIIFLESICTDKAVIDRNIRLKIQQSPDYAEMTDYEAAAADFKNRLLNYEKGYEPVEEGSYIKMIDMASGQGGQMQVNNISGYLPGRIVFFLVNTHITPRPILLTRHGESRDNVRGRIGGDPVLSEAGERYALKLAQFVKKRLKNERTTSIWTSTLQRTVLTARHIVNFPKVQWRALDEINAGICDGMTYQEIKDDMPEEHEARKLDKLRYRYPRGESYLDVIQRLEPVIIELERQRSPVVVIAHQAVLRALYAYFTDKPLKEIPHIEMPLHTVIEIQMGISGVQEKRYRLIDTSGLRSMLESNRSMNSASYP